MSGGVNSSSGGVSGGSFCDSEGSDPENGFSLTEACEELSGVEDGFSVRSPSEHDAKANDDITIKMTRIKDVSLMDALFISVFSFLECCEHIISLFL